jgi:diguanylate cyclase (GGDEF)-like protein
MEQTSFHALADALAEPLLLVADGGEVIAWNPAASEALPGLGTATAGRPLAEVMSGSPHRAVATPLGPAGARSLVRLEAGRAPDDEGWSEQAALRRVATAVAGGAAPEEVFGLVAKEVAALLRAGAGLVWRFDDDEAEIVGSWGPPAELTGTRIPLHGVGALAQVRSTGRPGRAQYRSLPPDDPAARQVPVEFHAGVAAPVRAGGGIWGVVYAATGGGADLPPHAEERLGRFAELVGLAIANAADRRSVMDHAAEQAALARVATLVAADADPREVFALVSREAALLLDLPMGSVVRRLDDDVLRVEATWSTEGVPTAPEGSSVRMRGEATRSALRGKRAVRTPVDAGGPAGEEWRAAFGDAIVAPILLHGEPWGGIVVAAAAGGPPPPAGAEARLAHFAELAAVAIANAEARRRSVDEAASAIAGGGLDMDATLRAVMRSARRALGSDRVTCLLVGPDGESVTAVFTTSEDEGVRAYLAAGPRDGAGMAAWERLLRAPDPIVVVGDVAEVPDERETAAAVGIGAYLGIRLEHRSVAREGLRGPLLGALFVGYESPRAFSARDIGAARSLGSIAGLAIANARLHAQTLEHLADAEARAASDPLTGLANHRAFHERLRAEVERARRHGRALSLALFDLDHFKEINDRYGHQVGDEVLAETAARLAAQARPEDLVARIGGEEFAWLLPESDSLDAWQAAERAREAIKLTPFARGERMTLSAGVAELAQASSATDLVRLADGALYWAKAHGRDISFRYSPEVVQVLSAEERAEHLERTQALNAIRALARAVDAKDPSTRRHSERVADLAVVLARHLGWDEQRAALLRETGLVHDVGKIGVPDSILFKPGRLTSGEYEQVKVHAALGAQIVADVLGAEQVRWVRSHHERLDGAGYPDGIEGDEIPVGARILAVADAWDVMTSARPYSRPVGPDEALEECRRMAGTQFCPSVVDALERLIAAGTVAAAEPV